MTEYFTNFNLRLFYVYYYYYVSLQVRIFDMFLHEGWIVTLRVGIALLKIERQGLLKMEFEELFPYIKQILPHQINADALWNSIPTIKFSRAEKKKVGLVVTSVRSVDAVAWA